MTGATPGPAPHCGDARLTRRFTARSARLNILEEKSERMHGLAKAFRKHATSARRYHLWRQARLGIALGTAATAATAAVVAPIIVAAL